MNLSIAAYFDNIESLLISSGVVRSFRIVRRQVSATDGKIRIRLTFVDHSEAEIFEYVVESGGQLFLQKYSFHWQDALGSLIRRWDNAPHLSHLPGEPHHVHQADGSVEGMSSVPDTAFIIAFIEEQTKQ